MEEKPKSLLSPQVLLSVDTETIALRVPKELKTALETYVPRAFKLSFIRVLLAEPFIKASSQEELSYRIFESLTSIQKAERDSRRQINPEEFENDAS